MIQKLRMMIAMMGMMLGWPFGIRMVNCKQLVELMGDYLGGDLPDHERRSLDLHVMACENCTNYVDTYRQTEELVHDLRYDDIPEDLKKGLHAVLQARLRG